MEVYEKEVYCSHVSAEDMSVQPTREEPVSRKVPFVLLEILAMVARSHMPLQERC